MLEIRNNLLEITTGVQKQYDRPCCIHDSVFLSAAGNTWLPTENDTRILISTLFRQIVQSPSTASLTALWTWRWLDRIPAMRAVSSSFCQDELVIATPVTQHYLEMQNHAITFQDFMKDPIIIREKGSGTKKEMDIFLEKLGITSSDLNVIARMNDLESIKKSIVNGLGISILSTRSTIDLQKQSRSFFFHLKNLLIKELFILSTVKTVF